MLALDGRPDVTAQLFWPDGRSQVRRGGGSVTVPGDALVELIFNEALTPADLLLLEQPAVVGVAALSSKVDDATVVDICAAFPDLRSFRLPKAPRVGARAMASIATLADVRDVQVVGAQLGAADLRPLATLEKLSRLTLERCGITDPQVADICRSDSLEQLNLTGNRPLSDACLRSVGRLPRLRWLFLAGCRITDAGLEHLCHATSLRVLVLSSTQVTDAGVRRLKLPTDAVVALPDGAEVMPVGDVVRGAPPAAELPARLRVDAPLLLLFTAPYCGPCHTTKAKLEQLPASLRERFKLVEVDVTAEPGLGSLFTVHAVPTVVLLFRAEEHFRSIGGKRAAQLQSALTSVLDELVPAR